MKKCVLLSIILGLFFSACSMFQSESFTGEWNFKLQGDYEGEFLLLMSEDMTYSESSVVNVNGRDYDVKLTGKIGEDGKLIGMIYAQGQQVGEMNGKFNYENGEGKWSAAGIGGTWNAVKKK